MSISIAFISVRRVLGLFASAFCHPYSRFALGVWGCRVGVYAKFTEGVVQVKGVFLQSGNVDRGDISHVQRVC